jgi:hypothetical protein
LRLLVWAGFAVPLVPLFDVIDQSLYFWLAISVTPGRAGMALLLLYPGSLFANEGYVIFAINAACWYLLLVLSGELLLWPLRKWRTRRPIADSPCAQIIPCQCSRQ